MNCQICDKKMKTYNIKGITIDECYICSKIWFDKGELKSFFDSHNLVYTKFEKGI